MSYSYNPYQDPGCAIIYTDGACSRNGQSDARAGIGVYWERPNRRDWDISERLEGPQTNQRAEIAAAVAGITQAKSYGFNRVHVLTDSHYVKDAAESWISNWDCNGWHGVQNKDLFVQLRNIMSMTTFAYVPSDDNKADPLARRGAAQP